MFYPLWKVDKLEEELHKFELNGWRLNSILLSCVFKFVKSKQKDSDYIITYNMAKDFVPDMFEYEQMLLADYSANKIKKKSTGFNAFRVTGNNRDSDELKNYRNNYIKHVLFQYMLISAVFLLLGILILLAAILQQEHGITIILSSAYTSISALCFLYRLLGYIKQAIKNKSN